LGSLWIIAWFALIPRGSLGPATPGAAGAPEVSTATTGSFARRFAVLIAVVGATSLWWQFYRAWMPKMLREFYGYSRGAVNYYTSAFYVATDVGCIGAGLAARR